VVKIIINCHSVIKKNKPKGKWYINKMKAKLEMEKSEQSHAQPKGEQKSDITTELIIVVTSLINLAEV
jgi:hypothetical protein